ncbi:MAG: hypothetical protein WBB27_10515, partial [Maribacter sp.]
YRLYCKHDTIVMKKLLQMLKTLAKKALNLNQLEDINLEIAQLKLDANTYIKNKRDLLKIETDFTSWS